MPTRTKMKFVITKPFFLIAVILFLFGCGNNTYNLLDNDTPTSGSISIAVDETFKPIIDSELMVFHALYRNAHITVHYLPESTCFKELMNDSVRLILTTRKLKNDEVEYFHKIKYFPTETAIAKDGIAIIVNKKNNDSVLNMVQLKQILNGQFQTWKQVSSTNRLSKIQIVFDHAGSSTVRYMRDSLIKNQTLPNNVYAAKTNEEVIDYVEKNENALGIIGVNWCKAPNDSSTLAFTHRIKVVGVQPEVATNKEISFPQPYQAYIAQGWYPLSRNIYTVSREARAGLGTGFVAFIASDRGQRIILKSGLVPATMPIRILSFNKDKKI
jgi:phosphate transport system substrate-binding protein